VVIVQWPYSAEDVLGFIDSYGLNGVVAAADQGFGAAVEDEGPKTWFDGR